MDIILEQILASAVRYIQENDVEGTKLYFDEIPENFYVPSVYFPVPQTSGRKATLSSYCVTVTVNCWMMARTDWEANARALNIRDSLMLDGCAVPIVKEDGNRTGKCFRTGEPEVRRIDEGIVQVSFPVKSYFMPKAPQATRMQNLYIAWKKATQPQREQEGI